MERLQIVQRLPSETLASGRRSPNKIKLSDGRYCTIGKGVKFADLQDGAFGDCEIVTSMNGEYENHQIETFVPVTPPGAQPPAEAGKPTSPTVSQTAYAKSDQKDRMIAMESATKPAGEIVAAMITAGLVTEEAEIVRLYEGFAVKGYEMALKAGMDSVATAVNPFADQ